MDWMDGDGLFRIFYLNHGYHGRSRIFKKIFLSVWISVIRGYTFFYIKGSLLIWNLNIKGGRFLIYHSHENGNLIKGKDCLK